MFLDFKKTGHDGAESHHQYERNLQYSEVPFFLKLSVFHLFS